MAFANGYTMQLVWNFDGLGWTYIAIAISWTIVLTAGTTFLISKRHLPFLRIRNVPLTVSAVAVIHIYWVLCLLAYVLQGYFPCATEYWIMSIYLPLGIALFQACNTQLLHIASLQRQYTDKAAYGRHYPALQPVKGWRRWMTRLEAENRIKRSMTFIAYGMAVQLIIAILIFLLSRKFHPRFGVTSSDIDTSQLDDLQFNNLQAAQKIACRRGWEWIPSIAWQFVWSWCYAPYLLWQVKDIQDNHGWRVQTTICCVAGLFGTPLWLCALYVPEMGIVNRYYIPPLWFVPSIFLIEACLIFVPCWQVLKNSRLQSETLDIIAEWESKNNGQSLKGQTLRSTSRESKDLSAKSVASSRRGELFTMQALESCIRTNPQQFLLFAALKDFSGENVSFLTKVLDWRRGWSPSSPVKSGFLRRPSIHEVNDVSIQRRQFKQAIDIYASYVSLRYSNYPINISHAHLKELEAVFEGAAMTIYGHLSDNSDSNSATPFDAFDVSAWSDGKSNSSDKDIEANSYRMDALSMPLSKTVTPGANSTFDIIFETAEYTPICPQTVAQTYNMNNTAIETLPDYVPVHPDFGPNIFDHAEESVKYMVLTNTWHKFVNAGYDATETKPKNTFLHTIFDKFGRSS